ncbi:hypothetical protein [Pedobacter suwonensis]|uniref:hypothetical protein n=1 Tax=Pedobacter suwonensis TaxID=332999 RepID=UPI00119FB4F3|nr:hypothetical protein [Pedobacter suwonensis]
MKFPKTISILLLFTLFGTTLPAREVAKPDPIAIVKNCIAAMGGESFLRSITTLYSNMKTEMEGRAVNYITKELLPNKGSFKIVYKENNSRGCNRLAIPEMMSRRISPYWL